MIFSRAAYGNMFVRKFITIISFYLATAYMQDFFHKFQNLEMRYLLTLRENRYTYTHIPNTIFRLWATYFCVKKASDLLNKPAV